MKTNLHKFTNGTIGLTCLNKSKTGLSSLGHILYELTQEVFGDKVGICPSCGSPIVCANIVSGFYYHDNIYNTLSKWFSHFTECTNYMCINQWNLLLKKEFWPESNQNKNKLSSQILTFGLSPGTLSLPINDEYILQDVLIMLKEAGYAQVKFGCDYRYKPTGRDDLINLDPKIYVKHFYRLFDVYDDDICIIFAYKSPNKDCLYNDNLTMLDFIFQNVLQIVPLDTNKYIPILNSQISNKLLKTGQQNIICNEPLLFYPDNEQCPVEITSASIVESSSKKIDNSVNFHIYCAQKYLIPESKNNLTSDECSDAQDLHIPQDPFSSTYFTTILNGLTVDLTK